jgi:hypothetical protein
MLISNPSTTMVELDNFHALFDVRGVSNPVEDNVVTSEKSTSNLNPEKRHYNEF